MTILSNEVLADMPEGSLYHHLSTLDIRQEYFDRGQVFLLAANPIVCALLNPAGPDGWDVKVIASLDTRYPVGGYDLFISSNELARSIKVDETELIDWVATHAAAQS